MSTYSLIIHIESSGTPLNMGFGPNAFGGDTSLGGHMWYEINETSESSTTSIAAGYTAKGAVNNDDRRYLGDPAYSSAAIPISRAAYDTLRDFGDSNRKLAEHYGFGPDNYNPASNSCVDYVWKALELVGLNPNQYQGSLLPMDNIDDLRRYMALTPDEAKRVDEMIANLLPLTYSPDGPAWNLTREELVKQWASAVNLPRVDPLILDLDGDGVETIDVAHGVHFNLDAIGLVERTGWVAPDDGLLVRDLDGNGRIESGRELFGNATVSSNGQTAAHGFSALSALDGNRDGCVDERDSAFSDLRIWKDRNANGVTDVGELLSLSEAGVRQLKVSYTESSQMDAQGHAHRQIGQFIGTDGATHAMHDVWLTGDRSRTIDGAADLPVSDAIAALPDLPGMGNVHSLHQSMARDDTGALQHALEDWQQSHGLDREWALDQLIYQWTGTQNAASRSHISMDARRISALEVLMGEHLPAHLSLGFRGVSDPLTRSLEGSFRTLREAVRDQLTDQVELAPALNGLRLHWADGRFDWDASALTHALAERFSSGSGVLDASMDLGHFMERLRTTGPEGLAEAVVAQSTREGAVFHQAITDWGTQTRSLLRGGEADDTLSHTGAGTSTLWGGAGKDWLIGGPGDDVHLFRRGDGHDTVVVSSLSWEPRGKDTLMLGSGTRPDDIALSRVQDDLVMHLSDTDSVTVKNHFRSPLQRIDRVVFDDGTTWSQGDIGRHLVMVGSNSNDYWAGLSDTDNHMRGMGGDDRLSGGTGQDRLDGGDGNDSLSAYAGHDVLLGGRGNDHLKGGTGDDLYHFDLGDGQDQIWDLWHRDAPDGGIDTLRFGASVTAQSLRFRRQGLDLEVLYGDGGDTVRIGHQFGGADERVEVLALADGSRWNLTLDPAQLLPGMTWSLQQLTASATAVV